MNIEIGKFYVCKNGWIRRIASYSPFEENVILWEGYSSDGSSWGDFGSCSISHMKTLAVRELTLEESSKMNVAQFKEKTTELLKPLIDFYLDNNLSISK